jgi:hypothetical protein
MAAPTYDKGSVFRLSDADREKTGRLNIRGILFVTGTVAATGANQFAPTDSAATTLFKVEQATETSFYKSFGKEGFVTDGFKMAVDPAGGASITVFLR